MSISNIIKVVIGLVVGVVLLPVITSIIAGINTTGMSSAVVTILDLFPTIYVLVLLVGAGAYLYSQK